MENYGSFISHFAPFVWQKKKHIWSIPILRKNNTKFCNAHGTFKKSSWGLVG